MLDLSSVPIVDTHEHIRPESERVSSGEGRDVLATFFSHYTSTDLLAAGLAPKDLEYVRDFNQPLETRWQRVEPVWKRTQHTGYGRSLAIAARDLYGIPKIDDTTVAELAERMRAALTPGMYARILERANIRLALVQDTNEGALPLPADPASHTRMVIKAHDLVLPRSQRELELVANSVGRSSVHSLSDWMDVCEAVFKRAPDAAAVKLPHAYVRTLEATKPTSHDAERVFNQIVRRREFFQVDESLSWDEARPLQDYVLRRVIELAVDRQLPIQIHTGILEGTFGDVRDAHPHHLIPLLLDYRDAKFVLFHGGYPWAAEFAALGKSFPNLWLDLCWLWVISPSVGRRLLHDLIEIVPTNKVCAFGGDYLFVEGVYGHACIARDNIRRVLQEKVSEGWFDESEALDYARAILHDNAASLYRS